MPSERLRYQRSAQKCHAPGFVIIANREAVADVGEEDAANSHYKKGLGVVESEK